MEEGVEAEEEAAGAKVQAAHLRVDSLSLQEGQVSCEDADDEGHRGAGVGELRLGQHWDEDVLPPTGQSTSDLCVTLTNSRLRDGLAEALLGRGSVGRGSCGSRKLLGRATVGRGCCPVIEAAASRLGSRLSVRQGCTSRVRSAAQC